MSREKKWGNKKGRNLQSKWKILASVWVLMLAFLLVPGMKSEAAAKTKISAPKSVKMYFINGKNYMGSTMSVLTGQGYIFVKNMPKNGSIEVLSCTNSKIEAVTGEYEFPYGGYQNGILIKTNANTVLKNKEKAVIAYKVKVGRQSFTYKTTVTFMKSQNPIKSIKINGETYNLNQPKMQGRVGGNNAYMYLSKQKYIPEGTPAKIHVNLKPAYKAARIEVSTWSEAQGRLINKNISNDTVLTSGVFGIRVYYYTSLPQNFKQSYYKRDKARPGSFGSTVPARQAADMRKEQIYWAKYRVVTYYFDQE